MHISIISCSSIFISILDVCFVFCLNYMFQWLYISILSLIISFGSIHLHIQDDFNQCFSLFQLGILCRRKQLQRSRHSTLMNIYTNKNTHMHTFFHQCVRHILIKTQSSSLHCIAFHNLALVDNFSNEWGEVCAQLNQHTIRIYSCI